MNFIYHGIEHTFQDTWMMFPFLLVTYLILEVFERKQKNTDEKVFFGLQKYGPIIGAVVGLIPQCGFSILAAMLFVQRNITMGTLIAVMIATSDEAIPILLSEPDLYSTLGMILILKFVIASAVGILVDRVLFPRQKIITFEQMEEVEDDDLEEGSVSSACPCCYVQYPIPVSAFLRSLKIYGFIFVTSLVLTWILEGIGEEQLSMILLSHSIFQPILASLFGFIPNCAATVVLTSLYVGGQLQFGSLLAGLITNAGLGLVVLFRYQEHKRNILWVILILWITAILFGMLFYGWGVI